MLEIKKYNSSNKDEWNKFIASSRQGTFLLNRNYMDYHADRFADHSLMIYKGSKLLALLPANYEGSTLYSHQGLTYGGLITNTKATVETVCEAFTAINSYLAANGFNHVIYKAIPYIYHLLPADEDLYALTNVCHARLTVRHISSTILPGISPAFAESRKSGLRKALRNNITVGTSNRLDLFWNILNNNLQHKYGARPVHSLAELQLLQSRFPDNIKLYMAWKGNEALGGTLIFETPQVIHTQYISASPEGKASGCLDMLFNWLINEKYRNCKYFDFGKSSVGNGSELNQPLIFQKEGFGGRGVCYDWYEWDI